jgi:hypothetical protein
LAVRLLCVCNAGHVRSVTLARLLRKRGWEVLSCGVDKNYSNETLLMLFNWADKIFFQKDAYEKLKNRIYKTGWSSEYVSTGFEAKADFRYDVGFDDWKIPQHPHLLEIMREMLKVIPVEGEYA